MSAEKTGQVQWWGNFTLKTDQEARWLVGPLSLIIQRYAFEWRLHWKHSSNFMAEHTEVEIPRAASEKKIKHLEHTLRFAAERDSEQFYLLPRLADRPLVASPETPVYILPGSRVTLYVSTPVWIQIEVEERREYLHEIPTFRPSDTWFGSNSLEGMLCYASRTAARLQLEDIPARSYRAITAVVIHNRAHDSLLLERLNLPVPKLSLFQSPDGTFCTQQVTLLRDRGGEMADMKIGNRPHVQARGAKLISGAREITERNIVLRAFNSFFIHE